jgi:hypothetical protein
MKKTLVAAAVVCLASVLGIGSAFAQMTNIMKVTLPVAVTVGSTVLPAGDCTIQSLQADGAGSVLLLRASDGTSIEVLANRINEAQSATQTHVTLRSEGTAHQLDRVWLAGQHTGYELLGVK